jgi:hypothetical protein
MKKTVSFLAACTLLAASAIVLSACDAAQAVYPTREKGQSAPSFGNEKKETIFGPEGMFGDRKKGEGSGEGIGVNSFLWRASLDTLAFMPIATADPFGGTIITDWHQLPESPNERFKLNVFILDRALRADGIKVSVFKQVRDQMGQWIDVKTEAKMAGDLENAILTRARQLRIVSTE